LIETRKGLSNVYTKMTANNKTHLVLDTIRGLYYK